MKKSKILNTQKRTKQEEQKKEVLSKEDEDKKEGEGGVGVERFSYPMKLIFRDVK